MKNTEKAIYRLESRCEECNNIIKDQFVDHDDECLHAYSNHFEEDMVQILAEEITKEIDKEVLSSILSLIV